MQPSLASDDIAALLDVHGAALRLYASGWSRMPDDCVQEAFIELARQSPPPQQPLAWLYRVVRRRAMVHHRSGRRRARHEQAAGERRPTIRDTTAQHEILDLLDQLDSQSRELVVLRVWGGRTFAEMAEITGRSTSGLHRDYTAALDTLRHLLREPSEVPHG
jgi:RNA polymerase sigma-70 factor (ECF subfamily)